MKRSINIYFIILCLLVTLHRQNLLTNLKEMEQSIIPIIVWSLVALVIFVAFATNAYCKVKAYNNKKRQLFIDADAVVVKVLEEDQPKPIGIIPLEALQFNHLAA